jgi:hypothetical protein
VRQAQLGQRVQPRVLGEVLNGQSRLIELGFRQGGTAGYGWSFCALQGSITFTIWLHDHPDGYFAPCTARGRMWALNFPSGSRSSYRRKMLLPYN